MYHNARILQQGSTRDFCLSNVILHRFSLRNPLPFEKFPPLLCTDLKQGEISLVLENFQKSQILECSEKLKNEVLNNLEGVDFWDPESQKVKNFPPLLCTDLQQGEIP